MSAEGARLVAECPELLVDLRRERDRLTGAIGELERARDALDVVIRSAAPDTERAAADLTEGTAARCDSVA